MVVAGAGTGGTVAGIGRKLKEDLPSVEVSETSSTYIDKMYSGFLVGCPKIATRICACVQKL